MQSKVLLPNMSGKIDFIGEPVKAIGYDSIKTNKRSQTICLYTTNFVGRFWLQGSLKDEPKEDLDWFVIPLTEETPYVEMNNFSMNPVKHDNRIYNVNGNYMWLRGKVDRKSYLHISNFLLRNTLLSFSTLFQGILMNMTSKSLSIKILSC